MAVDNEVVAFLMWGIDDDASRWIGGLVVDAAHLSDARELVGIKRPDL